MPKTISTMILSRSRPVIPTFGRQRNEGSFETRDEFGGPFKDVWEKEKLSSAGIEDPVVIVEIVWQSRAEASQLMST